MRVRLITETTIADFGTAHAASRASLAIWLHALKAAEWNTPDDIMSTYPTADLLGKGTSRVGFDVGGNKFRMICAYHFGLTKVHLYVKWMGTHAAYTKLCNEQLQYTVSDY